MSFLAMGTLAAREQQIKEFGILMSVILAIAFLMVLLPFKFFSAL